MQAQKEDLICLAEKNKKTKKQKNSFQVLDIPKLALKISINTSIYLSRVVVAVQSTIEASNYGLRVALTSHLPACAVHTKIMLTSGKGLGSAQVEERLHGNAKYI